MISPQHYKAACALPRFAQLRGFTLRAEPGGFIEATVDWIVTDSKGFHEALYGPPPFDLDAECAAALLRLEVWIEGAVMRAHEEHQEWAAARPKTHARARPVPWPVCLPAGATADVPWSTWGSA